MFKKIAAVALVLLCGLWLVFNPDRQAPAFELTSLEGNAISEQDLKGHVTLINFWYPSCIGCVTEMPILIDMHQKLAGQGFQVFAVSLNYNTLTEVKAYTETKALPFVVMYDADNRVGDTYDVQLAPASFLVDKKGQIVKSFVGDPNQAELEKQIIELLKS